MSKMSQLQMELNEQAVELGFENWEQAQAAGYEIDYKTGKLVDGRELAHNDWLKRKERILAKLKQLSNAYKGAKSITSVVDEAIDFIEEGEL